MSSFILQNPADLTRAGKTWTAVSSVLGSGGFTTSGTYSPGDTSDFIIIQIAPPAIGSLPATFLLSLNGFESSTGTAPTPVVDDTIGLGKSTGGILTANAAQTMAYGAAPGVRTWTINTTGISLSDLNAGLIYIYLGFTAIPASSSVFNSGNWSVTYSAIGQKDVNGAHTAWSGSGPFTAIAGVAPAPPQFASSAGDITATVTWTAGGSPPPYVPLNITSALSAGANVSTSGASSCAAAVIDAFGNVTNASGSSPQTISISPVQKALAILSGNIATFTGSLAAQGDAISADPLTSNTGATASVNMTAVVTTPDPTTLHLNGAVLTYMIGAGSPPPPPIDGHSIGKMNVFPPYAVSIK